MAVKRFDSSLKSFVGVSSSKRFDGTNWVDTKEICKYAYEYYDKTYFWYDCNWGDEYGVPTIISADKWDTGGDKNAELYESIVYTDDHKEMYCYSSIGSGSTTRYRWLKAEDFQVYPGQTIILNGHPDAGEYTGCSCHCVLSPIENRNPTLSNSSVFTFDGSGSTTIISPVYGNLYFVFTSQSEYSIGTLAFESIYVEPYMYDGGANFYIEGID